MQRKGENNDDSPTDSKIERLGGVECSRSNQRGCQSDRKSRRQSQRQDQSTTPSDRDDLAPLRGRRGDAKNHQPAESTRAKGLQRYATGDRAVVARGGERRREQQRHPANEGRVMATKDVPIGDIIDNPFQPRSSFDQTAIQSLADEIKAEGFWNTTLQGRRTSNGKIELVFGHRRLRALKRLRVQSVKVELVSLADNEMALRALEENLQREGLADFEKADGIKNAVDLEQRSGTGKTREQATLRVATRLGVSREWVNELCSQASILASERKIAERGDIRASSALAAKRWADKYGMGELYLKSLAQQAIDPDKSKPTEKTIQTMRRSVAQVAEHVRDRVRQEVFEGDLQTPEAVQRRASSLARASAKRREKESPPDLKVVIVGMKDEIKDWTKKLEAVAPYMDYIE